MKVWLGQELTWKSTFIFIYTNWKIIIEKSERLASITLSWGFLNDLTRFQGLARDHCLAGPSDLEILKLNLLLMGHMKTFMLVTFLWYIDFIKIVFYISRSHKTALILI